MERDNFQGSAEVTERKKDVKPPDVAMQDVLLAFKDVLSRAEMFARHHIQREPLSVRQRMSEVLSTLASENFTEFQDLFDPQEGRMGVAVTFIALLELLRERLIELVQAEPYSPIHVRAATVVSGTEDNGDGDGADDGDLINDEAAAD
jgi:segregation and condensation protein A